MKTNCLVPMHIAIRKSLTKIATCLLLVSAFFLSNLHAQCPLACRGLVNLSLNNIGNFTVNIYTVMNNPPAPCIPNYKITISDKDGNPVPNPVTCAYLGQTLSYSVIDTTTNNYCWGNLYVEDKFKPTLIASDVTINCNDADDVQSIGLVFAFDNCDSKPLILSQGEVKTMMDCNTTNGIFYTITRTWIALDKSGNYSDPKVQTITIRKPNINQIQWPKDYTVLNGNALDCADPDTSPDSLGYPLLNGKPLELACKILYTFQDSIVKRCSGSSTILRTWLVIDCCNNTTTNHLQTIEKVDKTPPFVICPADFTINTKQGLCSADVTLPIPVATDNCSDSIKITISGSGFGDLGYGPYLNVPPGFYEIKYLICDDCSNCTFCNLAFEVKDNESPTVICNNDISVSVDTNGMACVTVDDLNNGTTDNCCLDSLDVKIMGQSDSLYGPKAIFDCKDVNKTFWVILRALDCHGNVNFCMSSVHIFDTSPPAITCPSDITINCTESPIPDTTGFATAMDVCGIDTILFKDSTVLSPCNTGKIFRLWSAIDSSGNVSNCLQTISILDLTPSVINFPGDVTILCTLAPDSTLTGKPNPIDDCSLFSISHIDSFVTVPNGCDFFRRSWTVKDICKNLSFTQVQKITIFDNISPNWLNKIGSLDITVECDIDATTPVPQAVDDCTISRVTVSKDSVSMGCKNKYIKTLTYTAFDGCNNATPPFVVKITVNDKTKPLLLNCPKDTIVNAPADSCSKFIKFPSAVAFDNCSKVTLSNNSPGNKTGGNISGVYPVGTTKVKILAVDDCNNQDSCIVLVTVKDVTPPVADCADVTICLIGSIQQKDSLYILTPEIIKNNWNFFDLCSPVTATVTPDTFRCGQTGPPPKHFVLTITDASGNTTICNGKVLVVDSFNVCGSMFDNGSFVLGRVTTRNMNPLKFLQVDVSEDGIISKINTDLEGYYMFPHVPLGANISIKPYKTDDYLNGVDISDAIMLTKHLLGQQKFTDPYNYLAADVNNSHSLSVADLGEIKRLILHSQSAFSSKKSWKFLDAKCHDDILNDPMSALLPQEIDLADLKYHSLLNDFIAIKLGDINMSAPEYQLVSDKIDTRQEEQRILELPDMFLEKGKSYRIKLKLKEVQNLLGLQVALKFDPTISIKMTENKNGQLLQQDDVNLASNENMLYMAYINNRVENVDLYDTDLLEIEISSDRDIQLKDAVLLSEIPNANMLIEVKNKRKSLQLNFYKTNEIEADNGIVIYENKPNPFKQETTWSVYNNSQVSQINMQISSMDGRIIKSAQVELAPGYQEIKLKRSELPYTGCYIVHFSGENLNKVCKILASE